MRVGRFEIIEEIGAGGMGVVYKAMDSQSGGLVAIKMIGGGADIAATLLRTHVGDSPDALDQDRRMMLVREARLSSELRHPNIVSIFDYGQYFGLLYVVMEFLEGIPLSRLIDAGNPLPIASRLDIVIQLCDALAFAHDRGVMHRDVKPSNILVQGDGRVKILDFGLAARLAEPLPEKTIRVGTYAYMAPEIILGQSQYDARVDIWAAGITLFQLLAGRTPFLAPTVSQTFFRIVRDPLPPLRREIGGVEAIEAVLQRALAKDPNARYTSAAEMATDLKRLRHQLAGGEDLPMYADPQASNVFSAGGGSSRAGFDFSIGLADTNATVTYKSDVIAWRRVVAALNAFDFVMILRPWVMSVVFATMLLGWIATKLPVNEKVFGYLILGNAALALLGYVLFGAPRLARIPFDFLEHLEKVPRCSGCRSWMDAKSSWTRFAHTNEAVSLGLSDCVAALRMNLWEDAAKLLSLHADEYSPSIVNRIVSPPIRYHLDFYECHRCGSQCARVIADDKGDDDWAPRAGYFEAYKAGSGAPSTRILFRNWRHIAGALGHAAKEAAGGLAGLQTVLVYAGALLLFAMAIWLLKFLLTHSWTAIHPRF